MSKILRIANLAAEMTESQLAEICGRFGEVAKVRIVASPYSGQNRGFGFVEMGSETDATSCITGLNSTIAEGPKLSVTSSASDPFKKQKQRR